MAHFPREPVELRDREDLEAAASGIGQEAVERRPAVLRSAETVVNEFLDRSEPSCTGRQRITCFLCGERLNLYAT